MANPTLLSVPLCRDAEKNAIPVTDNGTTGKFSEQYGWQGINSLPLSAGGKAVERLDFNGVLALLGGIDYMTQRGYTFEYDNSLPYVAGCIVIDPLDGKTYRCINDVPIGASNPSNDPINWVSHDIADYVGGALRSTTYNVGDTSTLAGIPAGYFLECSTAGTTGATAPVITMPVSAGQTISDGTVVWTVRACASKAFVAQKYLPLSGGLLTDYKIGRNVDTSEIMIVSGADYGDGACLLARGKNYHIESARGSFQLEARLDASTYAQLIGLPSGDLTWQTNSLDKAAVIRENMGSNGYRQTADGFTVCWGIKTTGTASTGEFTIDYPISFANAVIAVVPTMVNNGTAAVPCEFVIRSMNESRATVAWRTYNGTTNVNGGVFWVAFGK